MTSLMHSAINGDLDIGKVGTFISVKQLLGDLPRSGVLLTRAKMKSYPQFAKFVGTLQDWDGGGCVEMCGIAMRVERDAISLWKVT